MGGIAVSDTDLPAPAGGRWALAAKLAPDVQKLVVSGFSRLPAARALFVHAERQGGAWIEALQTIAPVTAADAHGAPAAALAFTSCGLEQIGLETSLVQQFALPFVEGMMQPDRRRRLGDLGEAVETPIAWGTRAEQPKPGEPEMSTQLRQREVHALVLLYDVEHAPLDARVKKIADTLAPAGVTIVHDKVLDLMGDDNAKSREHFGFVDGISQPIPYGDGTLDVSGAEMKPDPLHGVRLGEILLGHPDAHENTTRGPFLLGRRENGVFVPTALDATTSGALDDPDAQERHDLVLNGSYLVVRELNQNVKGFWVSMEAAARRLNEEPTWLAERVVGRTVDGHLLRPQGPLASLPEGPDNDFLFFTDDRDGRGCPMGSHVRRANPRDGLSPKPDFCEGLLHSANAHRLLRRGRKFGGGIGDAGTPRVGSKTEPKGDEGLLFICLNGDISRQFEFVQQNWMLNPNFATLFGEVDPLVGPEGMMTLPAQPLRRRVKVETFVTLVGGDYFFLPSLPTLRILAGLRPGGP